MTQIEWTQHDTNFQMVFPEGCAIAVWISASQDLVIGFTYNLCIYVCGKRIYHSGHYTFEEAERVAIAWLEALQGQIKQALGSEIAAIARVSNQLN